MLVDTHTHFYDEWLLPEAEEAVERAVAAGVGKMIQADVDSHERPAMWEVGNRHPGVLYQMIGLYPGSVKEDWKEELDALEPFIALYRAWDGKGAAPFVAVGEIGLDYHEGKEFVKEQKEVLRIQLELAAELDLPVNIHLRDAWEDFTEVIEDCRHLHLRGDLHCFSGSYEIYERLNRSADFMVGIGGVVTFRNSSLQKTVQRIPLERILLETDAPYLAPVPHRGQRNESSYLPLVARQVALLKDIPYGLVEQVTTDNALKLFKLQ